MSREWYPWFPHRFWTSERVALMDDAAVALYKFLLDHEWENGPFSSDPRVLRALCSRFKSFENSWPQVVLCFQKDTQGRLYNGRMERERELERQASKARAERSKNAWTKRRDASEPDSGPLAEHVESTCSPYAEHVLCTTSATDGRTDGPTDGRTDLPTGVQGGAPLHAAEPLHTPSPSAQVGGKKSKAKKSVGDPDVELQGKPAWLSVRVRAWLEYRDERKLEKLTPIGLRSFVSRVEEWGEVRTIAAIVFSTSNGYQGLIEPHTNGNSGNGKPQATSRVIPSQKPDERERTLAERAAWNEWRVRSPGARPTAEELKSLVEKHLTANRLLD